jgi:hypothetical protein
MTAPGQSLPCQHNFTYGTCPHRGKGCHPPAEPVAPKVGDPCPVCRRNGSNYGSIACKSEHFQRALAKHKLDSENWHKTWDEPKPASPSATVRSQDFEPELPAAPIAMADHQVITFQSATHTGSIEWSRRFERYEGTAVPRDWKYGKRLPPQGAYTGETVAEVKQQLRERVEGVQFADERETVDESAESRDAKTETLVQRPLASLTTEEQAYFDKRMATPAERLAILKTLPTANQVPAFLAVLPRWVCWRKVQDENNPEKFRKPPFSPLSGKGIGAVEKYAAEFTDFATARAAAVRFKMSGVGFVFHQGDELVGIDIDGAVGADGAIDPEVQVWLRWFSQTWGEYSPSRRGIHLVGHATIAKALTATPLSKTCAATVEAYSTDRFFCVTGRLLEGAPLEVQEIQTSVTKLLSHLKIDDPLDAEPSADQHPLSKASALKIHADNLDALLHAQHGEGNTLLNKTAFFASRAFHGGVFEGSTAEQVKQQILDIPLRQWRNPHPEHSAVMTVNSGWESGKSQPLAIRKETPLNREIARLNQKFFVIKNYGQKCRVAWLEEEVHPELKGHIKLQHQSFSDFKNALLNERVRVGNDDDGNPRYEPLAPIWLSHYDRRQYWRVVFAPGQKVDEKYLNLWQGFSCVPQAGDCSCYLDHLKNIICNGNAEHYDYTIKWMARAVQHPGERGHVALVWRGDKGPGKNIAADAFGKLFGPHFMTITNAEHLVGRFNAHLRGKCVLVANEAFYAGNKQHEATLKGLITDVTLPIEQKFVDAETDVNLLHLIVLSNNEWVVPATEKERRFFMLDVSGARIGDLAYFKALAHELSHGGQEALLYHLLHLDLADFDARDVPHTEALHSQMAESLTGVEAAWYECLYRGELPGRVEKDGTAWLRGSEFVKWAGKQGRRDWSGLSAVKLGYLFGQNPRGKDKGMDFAKDKIGLFDTGQRNNSWRIPTLRDARDLWSRKRFKQTWEGTASDWQAAKED